MTENVEGLEGFDLEAQADLLLLKDATQRGATFVEYCYEYGLTGPAQRRRVRRHESNNFSGLLYAEAMDDSQEE